jgi:hypothetical protein
MNELKPKRFLLKGPVYPMGLWVIGKRLATREISIVYALSASFNDRMSVHTIAAPGMSRKI